MIQVVYQTDDNDKDDNELMKLLRRPAHFTDEEQHAMATWKKVLDRDPILKMVTILYDIFIQADTLATNGKGHRITHVLYYD